MCGCVRSTQSTSKKIYYVSDLSKLIVCTRAPISAGGGELPTKCSKGGDLAGSQFVERVAEKEGVIFINKNVFLLQLRFKL